MIDTEAFQELRTRQQLGYYVNVYSRVQTGVPGWIISVWRMDRERLFGLVEQ